MSDRSQNETSTRYLRCRRDDRRVVNQKDPVPVVFRLGVKQVVYSVVDVFMYRYDEEVEHEEEEQRYGDRDDNYEGCWILMESGSPIWNNGGDTVIVRNLSGDLVVQENY
jgi:hypothetical protein